MVRIRLFLLLAALFVTAPGCAEVPTQPDPQLPPVVQETVPEPIFGGAARVYEFNRGATQSIVLIHGINGEGLRDFAQLIPELARHYHVVTFDLPGFGNSDGNNGLYSPENYARFVHFITEARVRRPFILVGHSMGGAVALAYAAHYPHDLERLIGIDVAGILHRVAITKYMASSYAAEVTGTRGDGLVAKIAGKVMEDLGKLRLDTGSVLASPTARADMGSSTRVAGMALVEADFSTLLPQIAAPTLLVWGRDDPVAPLRTGMVLRSLLADARLEVIDGVGHVPMQDAPKQLLRHINDFLASGAPVARSRHLAPAAAGEERVGRCDHERDKHFEGNYKRIELRNCAGVLIRNVRAEEVVAFESRAEIFDSEIRGDDVALRSVGSELRVTASKLVAKTAIETERSSIDLAAVQLVGTSAAVRARDDETNLVFSLCTVSSPKKHGWLHTFINPGEDVTL